MEIEKNIKKSIVLLVFIYGWWVSISSALCFLLIMRGFLLIMGGYNLGNLEYVFYAHLILPLYLLYHVCPPNDFLFGIGFIIVWIGGILLGYSIINLAEKLCKKWRL